MPFSTMFDFQGKFIITLFYYFNGNPQLKVSSVFRVVLLSLGGGEGKYLFGFCYCHTEFPRLSDFGRIVEQRYCI